MAERLSGTKKQNEISVNLPNQGFHVRSLRSIAAREKLDEIEAEIGLAVFEGRNNTERFYNRLEVRCNRIRQ